MAHKNQGTGSWKGNRDKHEKTQRNGAKGGSNWVDHGPNTNSDRNRSRKSEKGIIDAIKDQIFGK